MTPSRLLTALAALLISMTAALPASFEGKWAGEIACPKLSLAPASVNVPFELTVSGALATYSREVSHPDTSNFVGIEEGTGIVSQDGNITLKVVGKSAGHRLGYTASYNGKLSGDSGALSGSQKWTSDDGNEDRDCTVTLKR
jgi:hypothetical protein